MTATQHDLLMRKLVGDNCYMDWVNRQQPTTSSSAAALASYAEDHCNCAIQCLMVGMEREAMELLTKADQWMTSALVRAEAGEGIELEYHRHFRHAVCRWLLLPPVTAHDLTRACQLLEASETTTQARAGSAFHLDLALPLWFSAGRNAECVSTYKQSGAKYPPPRKQQHTEGAMACLLAHERLQPATPEPDIQKRQHAFFGEQAPTFLKRGRYDRFALWVQITTRAEAGAPARAAIRQIADQYA